jgi:hypothetical protein
MQPVAAYPPYAGQHPHQRLHLHHHHHAPPPPQQHHYQQQQQQHPLHHDVYAPQPQYHAPLLLAPAYRPLQMPLPLPLQQQHSSPVVPPEHQQQQLALAQQQATTPAFAPQASAPDPGLHLHHHHSTHNHSQHPVAAYSQRRDRSQQSSMAYQPSDEEMAEMQRLSAAYESESTVCIIDARVTARFLHLAASECNPRTLPVR